MSRIHLFELEDQRWFPVFLRNYMTDFLQLLSNKTKMYAPTVPLLKAALHDCETRQIIDICSGGGGGLIWLGQELKKEIPELKILLTDLYPNISAFEHTARQADHFAYSHEPVDATAVPKDFHGLRTMFLSFHHFKPASARLILQNAIDQRAGILIFEAQERSIPSLLAMLFSPITVLLVSPFIRPFSLGRLFFTYLVPVVPLAVMWDGVVSALRTYSIAEMKELVDSVNNSDQFHWEMDRVKSGPGVLLYLKGIPKSM